MEDEGGLSFDFEGGLDTAASATAAAAPSSHFQHAGAPASSSLAQMNSSLVPGGGGGGGAAGGPQKLTSGRKNYRQTVCRHWLRGLCMKGEACGFLHQYDKARMPVCRFFAKFGECREPDCIYKHTNEDIKECNMYKLGFCPNGPDCRYRHQKLPGPPPSVEQNLNKIQHRVYAINGGGSHVGKYAPPPPLPSRQEPSQGQGGDVVPWQPPPERAPERPRNVAPASVPDDSHNQQPRLPRPSPPPAPLGVSLPSPPVSYPAGNGPSTPPAYTSAAIPLPSGFCRFFIVKSSNRENLELSVERGLWATHRNNESKLNEAYDTCDHVILIFSVNETRHFQGCARMMSKIGGIVGGGGWKYAHGTAHYGRNFRLKWLKMCELSFNKTRHLRNPYNDNLQVKISRDCQELEPNVGDQLAQLIYVEQDSDLMILAKEGEAKREEKVRGGPGSGPDVDDTDIIPFEDNEDDQEDDDSEDDDGLSQSMGAGNGGRGRGPLGPGQMWPGFGMGRGGRGMVGPSGGPGGRGMRFHPDMGDGFGVNFDRFGMGPGEGFNMGRGEMFGHPGGPGRGFPPFAHPGPGFGGPEFPNMGPGVGMNFGPMDGPGMVFHGRPPPPNGMFPLNGPGMMVPPGGPPPSMMLGGGARPPHFMGGGPGGHNGPGRPGGPFGPMGRPPRPMGGGNFRNQYGGGSGRGGRDQKRRRGDRSSGGDRGAGGEESKSSAKSRRGTSSTEENGPVDTESEFRSADQRQQDNSGQLNATYTGDNDEDDSESEDEAPRRSRHGEAKKRRRDWDAEDNGGANERWEQDAE